jgi:uncharacterized protein
MSTELKKITLARQLGTCGLLCAVALLVVIVFHSKPYVSNFIYGLSVPQQILAGAAISGAYAILSIIGKNYAANRKSTQHMIESYSRLDLSGWNPVWIALAAALGEELLFRGALQPLIGIWLTSVLFVVSHIRAYRFSTLDKRVLFQSLGIFTVSVVFGFMALYIGLITAIIVHAVIDIIGLYTIRRAILSQPEATG